MNELMTALQNWAILTVVIIGITGTTIETLVKPFIHTIISKVENGDEFKASKTYDYMFRMVVFGVAYLEAYPFRTELDIFVAADVTGVPTFFGVIVVAIAVTFFSKQIHDLVAFFKAWGNTKTDAGGVPGL